MEPALRVGHIVRRDELIPLWRVTLNRRLRDKEARDTFFQGQELHLFGSVSLEAGCFTLVKELDRHVGWRIDCLESAQREVR